MVRNHGEGHLRVESGCCRLFRIVSQECLKCESGSFQPGEGPSRGPLRDYAPSDGPSCQALVTSSIQHTSSIQSGLSYLFRIYIEP